MNIKRLLTPFALLNEIQFFAAINENLFKLLAAYFLIDEWGDQEADTIMAVIGALFLLPFILFSSLGGLLADKWSKTRIIWITRGLEWCILWVGLLIFSLHLSYWAYGVLFLMSTLSAIFGPSKYGVIPELVPPSRLVYANSVIAAFTYFGIIIGTTLASFVVFITDRQFAIAVIFCILIASAGWSLSFFLPQTAIANEKKQFQIFIYKDLWIAVKEMAKIPSLLLVMFCNAYFLFLGAFLQLNIIPYTIQILGFADIVGGYFFLLLAFGIGLGAYFTQLVFGEKIELAMIPLSGIGVSLVLFCLKWFYDPWFLIIPWMLLIGFLGGIYLVPSQAFILWASPEKDRGRNFGAAYFFSFVFAFLASIALYLLNTTLGFSPASSFLIIGVVNLMGMLIILIKTRWVINFISSKKGNRDMRRNK